MSHPVAPLLIAAVTVLALCSPVAASDPPKGVVKPIDPDKLKELQGAVEGSSEFAALTKGKRVVLASLVGYSDKAAETDATPSEFVETLHFNYDDGKTIRTVYNRTAKKVVTSESLAAYPTPLAGEEIVAARKLAEEKDEKVKALVANTPAGDLTVATLAPVVSKKDHPNYGKRLAVLIYTAKDKLRETQKVLVNLTDKTVTRD